MQEDGGLESSSEEGSSLDEPSWVSWFCMLRNHEFFCEVDPAFIQDRFNLYGLKEIVGPLYGEAMTMILGYAPTGARTGVGQAAYPLQAHWVTALPPVPTMLPTAERSALCSVLAQRSSCQTHRSASTRCLRRRECSTG